MALHGLTPPRRQRAGCLAGLRGRAVHAADGHHLRAAGVRAGAGLSVGRAVRARQAARPGEPPAGRGQRHAVAGAWPRRGSAAVDRPAQSRTGGGQRGARHAVAAARRAAGRRPSGPRADRDTLRAERDRLAQQLPTPTLQARSARRAARSGCSRNSPRRPAAPMPPSRRPRRATQLAEARRSWRRHEPARGRRRSLPRCSGRSAELDKTVQATRRPSGAAVRSREAGGAEPRACRRCATAGEAGAGRCRARDDRAAAARRGRGAACRGEAARRFGTARRSRCSTGRWTS